MKIHALMGATALALVASPALADASPFASMAGSILGDVLWPLAGVAGSIGTYLAGRAILAAGNKLWDAINRGLDAFERKTGIEVDARNREALHSALETGLNMAVKRGAPILEDAIAAWVKQSVPGAITHFGLTDEKLDALVDAKLGKAASGAVASAAASAVAAAVPPALEAPLALPGAALAGLAGAGEATISAPLTALAAGVLGGR